MIHSMKEKTFEVMNIRRENKSNFVIKKMKEPANYRKAYRLKPPRITAGTGRVPGPPLCVAVRARF